MAVVFQLSIECGDDDALVGSVARHFETYSFAISEIVNSTCSTRTITDAERNRWAIVHPSGLSASGISTAEDAERMTIAGRHLYERLLSSPPFRYAIAGVESEEFRSFTELKEMDASLYSRLDGLVMSREIWSSVGRPAGFVEFSVGYLWRPYMGETVPSPGDISFTSGL